MVARDRAGAGDPAFPRTAARLRRRGGLRQDPADAGAGGSQRTSRRRHHDQRRSRLRLPGQHLLRRRSLPGARRRRPRCRATRAASRRGGDARGAGGARDASPWTAPSRCCSARSSARRTRASSSCRRRGRRKARRRRPAADGVEPLRRRRPTRDGAAPNAAADRDARLEQPEASRRSTEQDQVAATTVFDRDSRRRGRSGGGGGAAPDVCLPDDRFDIGGLVERPAARRRNCRCCAASSSASSTPPTPRPARLARLYIRFGFGAEAEALLAGFDGGPEPEDRALLVDMARAVEGRPATPDGPLAVGGAPAPGQHGLWQALGGVAPVWRDAASFVSVQAAFQALPPDLRPLVGPGLAARLIDAGHPAEARVIFDTTARPGGSRTPRSRSSARGSPPSRGSRSRRCRRWPRWSRARPRLGRGAG